MVRRSTPKQVLAEWYFPIRVRVAVPPGGLGSKFDAMQLWLSQHVGTGTYFIGGEAGAGLQDAALFYFLDADIAAAFVSHFGCGLVIGREPPR